MMPHITQPLFATQDSLWAGRQPAGGALHHSHYQVQPLVELTLQGKYSMPSTEARGILFLTCLVMSRSEGGANTS